ncbi:MAG: alpha/beta hydrolase [Chthoniobacteraceae bacterium]
MPRHFSPKTGLLALLLMNPLLSPAQSPTPAASPSPSTIAGDPLWPQGAPGALGNKPQDIPTLTSYPALPAQDNAPALVIFPGGGYAKLADHEGAGYAEFFRRHGFNCYVVKYRLGSNGYRHPIMLEDAARAVRTVRAQATDWKLDAHRIGIIGSSAGGHLASTLATHFDAGQPSATDPIDRESSRPDFAILCYPVITMGPETHVGSKKNLLGDNPSQELMDALSNEKQVTKDTPPCFVWTNGEDKTVPPVNTLLFAEALQKAGVPFDVHIYEKGGHGVGLGKGAMAGHLPWISDCLYWLKANKILN